MTVIALANGAEALISDIDCPVITPYKWRKNDKGYVVRTVSLGHQRKTTEAMHRRIMQPPTGLDVDHINGDRLDNRRENLRIATRSQNGRNAGLGRSNTSGYKGVTWHKRRGKWMAQIKLESQLKFLGYFLIKEEAAMAYNEAAIQYYGEFARLNHVKAKEQES